MVKQLVRLAINPWAQPGPSQGSWHVPVLNQLLILPSRFVDKWVPGKPPLSVDADVVVVV